WPGSDSINLDGVHRYIVRGDNKSEVFNRVCFESALGGFQEQVIVQEYLHDLGRHASVFFDGFREYQNVIHIDCQDLCHNEVMENDVHHCLESGG
ncbi:hypothetical protein HETIRDRAFT_313870, partial [Heterobasidion irregulare TC 32-1]